MKPLATPLSIASLLLAFSLAHADVPVPAAPQVPAKSYILIDHHSGRVLAEHEADVRMEPASIVKVMTAYAVFDAIRTGKLKLDDQITVSEYAWRVGGAKTDGSTTYLKLGSQVPVTVLLQGMIVQSGNDATIALAERVGGNEATFASLMNNYAQKLGLKNSHFDNSTGLPSPGNYMSARDIVMLAHALIKEFPEYYRYYSQHDFTWNGIKQGNRNGLLTRDSSVDGIKTGHTVSAGYCLAASAKRDGMRMISVVLGTGSFRAREDANLALLNYGFSFFETKRAYTALRPLGQARVRRSDEGHVAVGLHESLDLTVPRGRFSQLKPVVTLKPDLMAPLSTQTPVGELKLMLGDEVVATRPLFALKEIKEGGLWTRMVDHIKSWFE